MTGEGSSVKLAGEGEEIYFQFKQILSVGSNR
jgi:hypothetical protein